MSKTPATLNETIKNYLYETSDDNFRKFFYETKDFFLNYTYKHWPEMLRQDREDLIITTIEKYIDPKWINHLRDGLITASYTTWLISDLRQRKFNQDMKNMRHRKRNKFMIEMYEQSERNIKLDKLCYESDYYDVIPHVSDWIIEDREQCNLLKNIRDYLNNRYKTTKKEKYNYYLKYLFDNLTMEQLIQETNLNYNTIQINICRVGKEIRNLFGHNYKTIMEA